MRKKIVSLLLCCALALSLAPAAFALGGFADVSDAATARNVEVLRLLGVIEGDDNASFRPGSSLTRAEFCKMAVVLSGKRSAVTRYAGTTIFEDVKASHWASGYVNYAARDAGLIHGMPDGTFQPDRAITYGEAVTILMRQLGYKDENTGGIWPDGYIALAGEAGMTKGVAAAGGASITRAQAAQLFVNALTSQNDEGTNLLTKLGYTVDLTKETTLWSVDAVNNKLRTADGDEPMEKAVASTALNGLKGYVVRKGTKAVTFLPVTGTAGGAVSDAAIVVSADKSTAGFDALTGGAADYTVYRNGVRATAAALKKNDVVTYNAANNTIQACDTRVVVYYETCTPSPSAPTEITVLGGTKFAVLPTAQQSLSKFKPGQVMVVQLTADGRVAGAVANGTSGAQANAFGYVDGDGGLSLICGGSLRELKGTYSDYAGQAVRVSQSTKTTVSLSGQSSGSTGILDLTAKTLGTRKLADGVLVFSGGALTSLEALGVSRIEQDRIAYARTNSANEVDLIVIADSGNAYYGRAKIGSGTRRGYPFDDITYATLQVNYGENKWTEELECAYVVNNGDYVEAVPNSAGDRYISVAVLAKLASVPTSAWIGDTAVNYSGQTYVVYPKTVICYNRDAGAWFTAASADSTALAAAKAYGGTMDLYVKDGVVRVIEVHA